MDPISQSATLHYAGKACQGQALWLIGFINILQKNEVLLIWPRELIVSRNFGVNLFTPFIQLDHLNPI